MSSIEVVDCFIQMGLGATKNKQKEGGDMPQFAVIVLAAIVANILTPTVKYLWRSIARFFRRHYLRHDSTQRIICKRRHWRKTSNLRKHVHHFITALLSNLIDIEYIEWREAISKNNARLYRQSVRTTRWTRFSQERLEDCLVDPSYDQYLELLMDEVSARFLAENKPIAVRAIEKGLTKTSKEFDQHKREYDKHIELDFIANRNRYESLLHWGFMSNHPPHIVARVYEEQSLSFPEDLHTRSEGGRSFYVAHIYRFMDENFPEKHEH